MSELREIELQIKPADYSLVQQVVARAGGSIVYDAVPNSYATRRIKADVVIRYGGVEFGIKDGQLIYDNMHGSTVASFVKEYLVEKLRRRGVTPKVTETQREYILVV